MHRKITAVVLATFLAFCSAGMTKIFAAAPDSLSYSFVVTSKPVCAFSGMVSFPSDSLEVESVQLCSQSGTQYSVSEGAVIFNGSDTADSFDFSEGAVMIKIEFKVNFDYDRNRIKTRLSDFYSLEQCAKFENEPFYFSEYINQRLVGRGYFDLDNPMDSYIDPEESLPDEPDVILGDVNGDGKITIDDTTMIQKALAEIVTLADVQKRAADANGDGSITIDDATMIQKYLAEMIDHLGK